jgi:hypothetical protein
MKTNYEIDLEGFNVVMYQCNPIVTLNYGYALGDYLGRAQISEDKKSVEVKFFEDKVPEYDHELLPSYLVAGTQKELVGLSVVPK